MRREVDVHIGISMDMVMGMRVGRDVDIDIGIGSGRRNDIIGIVQEKDIFGIDRGIGVVMGRDDGSGKE